jgi:hypothetical protein
MSIRYQQRTSLEIKTDAIAFPLIEKKPALVFFVLYEKRLRPLRELFHATVATIPHNHKVPSIKNNLVPI